MSLPLHFTFEDKSFEDDRCGDLFSIDDGFHGCYDVHFPNEHVMGMDYSKFVGEPTNGSSNEK